jgi:hypothetical protein
MTPSPVPTPDKGGPVDDRDEIEHPAASGEQTPAETPSAPPGAPLDPSAPPRPPLDAPRPTNDPEPPAVVPTEPVRRTVAPNPDSAARGIGVASPGESPVAQTDPTHVMNLIHDIAHEFDTLKAGFTAHGEPFGGDTHGILRRLDRAFVDVSRVIRTHLNPPTG